MNMEFLIDIITLAMLVVITLYARWKAENNIKDYINGKKNRLIWFARWFFPDESRYNPHIKRFLWMVVFVMFLLYSYLFTTFAVKKHVLRDTYDPGFLAGILYPFRAIYLVFK